MNKYEELFASYAPVLGLEELQLNIKDILGKGYEANNTPEVRRFIHGCIDLTTLTTKDTETSVSALVNQVNGYEGLDEELPNVAAVCVYPNFVPTVREGLTDPAVKVACVSGAFPSSQTFVEVKIAETALAVSAGADEVDVVLNLGKFLEGDYEEVVSELSELKDACREARLKVIIESGALEDGEAIRRASLLSLAAGADFLKTSTGKEYAGASLEAAFVMCRVVHEYYQKHGVRKGLKFSGGIRTAEDAIKYYTLVRHILGADWLTPELFRIGASSLVAQLQSEIL